MLNYIEEPLRRNLNISEKEVIEWSHDDVKIIVQAPCKFDIFN